MAKPRYLTKSRFKLGRECGTKLFYTGKKEQYEDQSLDDSFLQALASGGFQVGELAKIYYPDGHMIDTLDYQEAWEQTDRLLKLEKVTIYEAAFRFESLFVRVDVLVKNGDQVQLIEVKSKSFDPNDDDAFYDKTALKRGSKKLKSNWAPYLEDVAFQTHVARRERPKLKITPYLMLADKSKVTSVAGLNQCFLLLPSRDGRQHVKVKPGTSPKSVGEQILCRICVADEVALIHEGEGKRSYQQIVDELASAYVSDTKLAPQIGTQCKTCQFKSDAQDKSGFHQCWKEAAHLKGDELEGPFVFDVWNFRKASALIEGGTYLMRDIPVDTLKDKESDESGLSMVARQRIQIEAASNNSSKPYIDRNGLASEIASWRYPLHFIDFETTMVAIPFNSGRRPYEQMAFQFSHHQVESDGTVRHQGQYINQAVGVFPNFDFVRALKRELDKDQGTIFRYAAHENTVLCQIYDQLENSEESDKSELQRWIRTVTTSKSEDRGTWSGERSMVDMCDLVKRYYYHPMTNGSNSIKKVLPATLHESRAVKERYSKPLYGSAAGIPSLNFKNWTWVQFDADGAVVDPYSLLPSIFEGVDTTKLDLLLGSDELAEGGAAMMAYAKMQFSEMSDAERQAVVNALLKYCELDTLAMVMLFEYWAETTGLKVGAAA